MATEAPAMIVNGGPLPSKSAAALLEEQHARQDVYRATIEDVPDEDDIQHPPPSSLVADGTDSAKGSSNVTVLDGSSAVSKSATKPSSPILDVRSEELVPALGSGPKPKVAATMPMAWGASRKAASVSTPINGLSNGPLQSCTSLLNYAVYFGLTNFRISRVFDSSRPCDS